MEEVGAGTYGDYIDFLEVHPEEFALLFNTILINVTGFFRDAPSWDYLTADILPKLIEARAPDQPIRIWCAGCASGEEAYTVAILLAEALGAEEYAARVKIYATDVDEEALDHARSGVYSTKQVEAVPAELRNRYFDRLDQRYAFRKDLRRTAIFGRNDLVQDAPISRVDLLMCRNTLMYFNAETQERILRRFNFALNNDGYLFLGKSEMLIDHYDLFVPVSMRRRVFTKVAMPRMHDRLMFVGAGVDGEGDRTLQQGAFDAAPIAQILLDRDGVLVHANRAARDLLNLNPRDHGRPLKDLELSYRPVELRGHLETVFNDGRTVSLPPGPFSPGEGDERVLQVTLTPIANQDALTGASVTFVDLTSQQQVQDELERAKRELSVAYEELQSTVEELETTNEELQSTNEELETTNEELQSSNEELETMNEELQSSNEELETMNDELRQRTLALDEVNAFMEAVLTSLGIGVIVLDRRQHIEVWNGQAQELWGLRADEVEGNHVLSLDIGLPVDQLRQPIRAVMGGEAREELELDATDRRGRSFRCRVSVLPLARAGEDPTGAVVLAERLPD